MDELAEELEHQEFMDALARIEEQIFFSLCTLPVGLSGLKGVWDDVAVFGNEPIFTSLIFDKAIEEAGYESNE